MERDIRNSFYDKKTIDVLFLSHFDDDHVNYVKYLKNHGCLDGTRIFIPMIEAEKWFGIRPYYTNFKYILSLNDLNKSETKVIKVAFGNEEGEDFVNNNDPLTIESIDGDTITSGTQLKHEFNGILWCYVPFNVRFKALIAEFKKSLTDNNLDYNRLKDPDYVTAHIRNLRRIYQNLGKKPTRGTAINLNSMLVMSYPMNQDNCRCFRHRGMFKCSCDCLVSRWRDGYTGSCLYTGDTSANDSEVWQTIEQIITRCFRHDKKLVMLQVPHHGSKNSYDQKLVGSDKFLHGFANYDPYYRQHIFDDDLPMKFAAKGKRLVLVTREYASLFEAYYKLDDL